MSNFGQWETKDIRTTRLMLDPENPRILSAHESLGQEEILGELIHREDVYGLARDIANQGYYPTETLVAIAGEGRRYVVVEGNRRLAAIRLLENPELAPESERSRFSALAREAVGRVPDEVRVTIAPNRVAARPLILNRHTRSDIKKWNVFMQGRYIEQMVRDGFSLSEIILQTGLAPDNVKRRLRDAKLYRMFLSCELDEDVRRIVDDPHRFSHSTAQRLAESKVGREWLGLAPADEEGYRIRSRPADLRKALSRVAADIVHKDVTTRTLHDESKVKEYLGSIKRLKPMRRASGSTTADAFIGGGAAATRTPATAVPARRSTVRESKSILPHGLQCRLNNGRIIQLFKELRSLTLAKYPNASAIMLRSLVDMALGSYLDKTGHTTKIKQELSKKQPKPADWAPSLAQMLKYVLNKTKESEVPLPPTGRRALQRLVSARDTALTLESMDGFVHNRYMTPTVEDLRALSVTLQPLLELVLTEPEVS